VAPWEERAEAGLCLLYGFASEWAADKRKTGEEG
jgi:hypothetical protein